MSITDFQLVGFKRNILIVLSTLSVLTILVRILVAVSYMLKTNKTKITREKLSAFECGFDPEHKMRNSFSLRFFIITVVFLIFDVEVAIMLPIPITSNSIEYAGFFFSNMLLFIILFGGLMFEWTQGALEWHWRNI